MPVLLLCAHGLGATAVGAFQTVPVEETIRAAQAGDLEVRETLARAAAECGSDPTSWQRQVLAGVVDLPPSSLHLDAFRVTIPIVATASRECREELGVRAWVRSALDEDIPELFYREMLVGLNQAQFVGYMTMDALAGDTTADPRHRLLATEVLVGTDRSSRGPDIEGLPARLAERYRASGLPPDYLEEWLPMLLAAVETREAAAQQLMGTVSIRPDQEGAAEIVRIVGANVEAYDQRFSPETRGRVSAVLDMLLRRPDVPDDVAEMVRQTMVARREGRNHLGVLVQSFPLDLAVRTVGENACAVAWPAVMASTVEAVAPGFVATPRRGSCEGVVRSADFNGDGLQDALVRGTSDDRTILLAVIAGPRARAHVVGRLGADDYAVIAPPGAFTPICDSYETFVFPNEYITVSYDEKASTNFRFDGREFEELMGDRC